MSDFKSELLRWASEMKENWDEIALDIEKVIGTEQVQVFDVKLNELLDLLQDHNDSRNVDELHQMADELYSLWETLASKERAEKEAKMSPVPIGGHTLPPLPYAYDALEPYIAAEIMELHHKKHHQSYVDGLNKAEKKLQEARQKGDFDLVKHWSRELAFHGAGHYLHTIFWNVMSPKGGGEPRGALAEQIKKDFGSFQNFKKHFSKAAEKVEGVGWAILVWSPRAHRLEILQAEMHHKLSQQDVVPILPLDVWEHAYYLQYKNERAEYIKNWWNVVCWKSANERFEEAKKLKWKPY